MDDMGWMKGDEPFQVTTTNGKKYWLSHDTIKAGDFVVYQTASGLWREYGKINPEKVDDANTFTDYYKVIDPLMMEEEMDELDWIRKAPVSLPKDHKPKEGSIMICIPGFTEEWNNSKYNAAGFDPNYGGGGYQEGKVITVDSTTSWGKEDRTVVWPKEGGYGVYVDALNYY